MARTAPFPRVPRSMLPICGPGSGRRWTPSSQPGSPSSPSSARTRPPVRGGDRPARRGKRLRPAFCYWAWRGAGGDDSPEAIAAATSLELLQACALVHDDVMDGSDTRRGLPAAHRRFAALHRESGWLGSPEDFGVGSAILLGDLCLSWADQMLLSSGLPAAALERAKPVYDDMRTELMAGQYMDLLEQARGGGSVERALRVVRYKSAKHTIERLLELGATLAAPTRRWWSATRPTACRSARPSSCATMSWASSATRRHRQAGRRRPARGQAHRPSSRSRWRLRTPRRRRCWATVWAILTSTRPGRGPAAGDRRHGEPWQPWKTSSKPCARSPSRRWTRWAWLTPQTPCCAS